MLSEIFACDYGKLNKVFLQQFIAKWPFCNRNMNLTTPFDQKCLICNIVALLPPRRKTKFNLPLREEHLDSQESIGGQFG